ARYRKEATDSLDEVAISFIRDRLSQLEEMDQRRDTILNSLEQHGHLTDELKEKVMAAETLAALEDIYLPYRPKRRTRATIAKERGLEPLADTLFAQTGINELDSIASMYVDSEKEVEDIEDALAGARDIIAEKVNEDQQARAKLRQLFLDKAIFKSKVATEMEIQGVKFKDYFDWSEPASTAPSHRILAMRRGEKEDVLNLNILPAEQDAITILKKLFVHGNGKDSEQVALAVHDSYKRLLSRSMETEIRLATKQRADTDAIAVFADNLRQLLMAAPMGAKRIMGIDPGYRTGCKVVCLDRQGKFLTHETIFPHTSSQQTETAKQILLKLTDQYRIEAVAVGNGTAGRETEAFVKALFSGKNIPIIMVNESGASVYSASEVAREEFPDLDLTIRGAISIGRRLMDPLSELVKIDPKSIGVGQYQHDVDQSALKSALDDVVISCVNGVGVDVNRASAQLLTYVSGLGPGLAKKIVTYRDAHGAFTERESLKNVPRLGPKAFEQCAGFLRIKNGHHPLDASAVHPERYELVNAMAKDLGCKVSELIANSKKIDQIQLDKYVTKEVGIPTLKDIIAELSKPGRDPRETFEEFSFASHVEKIEDLEAGMQLPGLVTNVTAFGAFVDIGVHQDGLVHISQLADQFVKDPAQVVKVQQKVKVTVLEVDIDRKRISLSMKSQTEPIAKKKPKQSKRGPKDKKTSKSFKGTAHSKKPFNNPFADLFGKS
ncbi:MAG: Tex family protein, partial [Desulfobacteraceae bacterium]